jgi:hypothetical protein
MLAGDNRLRFYERCVMTMKATVGKVRKWIERKKLKQYWFLFRDLFLLFCWAVWAIGWVIICWLLPRLIDCAVNAPRNIFVGKQEGKTA